MGRSVSYVLSQQPYGLSAKVFLVSDETDNQNRLFDNKIICADKIEDKTKPIIVALHEKNIEEVIRYLKELNYTTIVPISFDCDLWSEIRKRWMQFNGLFQNPDLVVDSNNHEKSIHTYVVHSIYDRKLNEKIIDNDNEIPIQVGAALTDENICKICDAVGDNISEKNAKYCELTALYWIWKNDNSDYKGICHYRRRFIWDDGLISKYIEGDVDFIVTVPVFNIDTVKKQYAADHDKADWDTMVEAIGYLYPDYSEAIEKIGNGQFYYAYNMFIAKERVFNEYCAWLFPILEYCEQRIESKDNKYQSRYMGFLGERLLSIYIAHNSELKVAISDKHFIG